MGDNYGISIKDGMFNGSSWFIEKTERVIRLVLEQMDIIENINSECTSDNLKEKCEGELLDLCSIYCLLNNIEPDSNLNKKLMSSNRKNVLEKIKVYYGLGDKKNNECKNKFKVICKQIKELLKSRDSHATIAIKNIILENKDKLKVYENQLKNIEECLENIQGGYITWDIGKVIIECILDNYKGT